MSVRNAYTVSYDIADAKRLRRIHRRMLGFGDPVQYSVFRCELSPIERELMITALTEVIHHTEDQVMIVDLGPVGGGVDQRVRFLGRHTPPPERAPTIV